MGLSKKKKTKRKAKLPETIIGYARVSKGDTQSVRPQVKALKGAGATKIFKETLSGGRWDRPELHRMLDHLRPGDVVVVWKLDRLSRSLKDLLSILDKIDTKGAGFRSLTESVDTTTAAGRMMMQIVGSFAEFERSMIRERVQAGVDAARAEGRVGGRPVKLTPRQQNAAIKMVLGDGKTAAETARIFEVHPSTIGRLIAKQGV